MNTKKDYMNNSNNITNQINYNDDPVFYCKHCLSLAIKFVGNVEYCEECGGTEIEQTDIHTWDKKYEEKYGVKYLKTKKNGSSKK